jgi:hypothetical protein
MAGRKMSFVLPEEVAGQLLRRVPARDHSRYVSEAIAEKLRTREERLIQACEAANRDPETAAIESEWDALPDETSEPWADATSR